MHSAFISWKRAWRGFPVCHEYEMWRGRGGPEGPPEEAFGGGFGVRRPLRFLAHQLGLDERQVAELARTLDDLKTERAQAEVDRRRTLSAFSDAFTSEAFNDAKAAEAGELRVQSATRLRDAVLNALRRMHAALNPDQRARLAYLIRSGMLSV
jgi:Spy/CpxP family protein refolding chaperone